MTQLNVSNTELVKTIKESIKTHCDDNSPPCVRFGFGFITSLYEHGIVTAEEYDILYDWVTEEGSAGRILDCSLNS